MSYEIKQKHHDARRNILYNNETMGLVLDFYLEAEEQWRRISSVQAKKKRNPTSGNHQNVGDDELDCILGRSREITLE